MLTPPRGHDEDRWVCSGRVFSSLGAFTPAVKTHKARLGTFLTAWLSLKCWLVWDFFESVSSLLSDLASGVNKSTSKRLNMVVGLSEFPCKGLNCIELQWMQFIASHHNWDEAYDAEGFVTYYSTICVIIVAVYIIMAGLVGKIFSLFYYFILLHYCNQRKNKTINSAPVIEKNISWCRLFAVTCAVFKYFMKYILNQACRVSTFITNVCKCGGVAWTIAQRDQFHGILLLTSWRSFSSRWLLRLLQ